jgi:hypothetical protein
MSEQLLARCRCGAVVVATIGKPIITSICYCMGCQSAARLVAARPGGAIETTPDGGTECLIFRKDRFVVAKGAERLEALRLKQDALTRRMIATCCNSGMYMAFDDSKPWVSAFRARFVGEIPPVEMRICTKYRRSPERLDDRLPNYPGFPGRMMLRILAAWTAMLFTPKSATLP